MSGAEVGERLDVLAEPLAGTVAVEASAGTGKTYTLSQLYLRLVVEAGLAVREILVVTYTKAATAELRDRIRARLAAARTALARGVAESDDAVLRAYLAGLRDRDGACAALERALGGFDEAAIFTIHGFCQRVLAERAFESGTAFDAELVPDQQALVREVVEDFWRRELYGASAPFVAHALTQGKLTPDALVRLARDHAGRPYRAVEGPDESSDDAALEAALAAAVAEVRTRWTADAEAALAVLRATPGLDRNVYKVPAIERWRAAVDTALDDARAAAELPAACERFAAGRLAERTRRGSPPAHPLFDACERLVVSAAALHSAYANRVAALRGRLVCFATEELARRKAEQGIQHYDDLVASLAQALADPAQGEALAALVRTRYRAALVDEFQDTDSVQYEIFQRIYGDTDAPVFYVGDPKQAIYGFRGADVFTYLRARAAASRRCHLERNWRTERALVQGVNAVFGGAVAPFVLEDIPFLAADVGDLPRPPLVIDGQDGAGLRLWRLDEGERLDKGVARERAASATAAEVARLVRLGASGAARIGDLPLHGGHMAVLVRTNGEGRLVRERLRALGVPSVQQAVDSVFASREALELERVLLAVTEPAHAALVRAALATEMLGVDAATLVGFDEDERAWERRIEAFHEYHRVWRDQGFARMCRDLLWRESVHARLLAHEDGERRLTNLLHLVELLQGEWARERAGMDMLVDWLADARRAAAGDDDEQQLRLESDAELVQIVTVHKAKGLEYRIVFCPFLWDGRLYAEKADGVVVHDDPDDARATLDFGSPRQDERRAQALREELAEKLRLLYVALTRGVYRTYVAWGKVKDGGTAPLAWLLHAPADAASAADPLAAVAERYEKLSSAAFDADLAVLTARADGTIVIEAAPSSEGAARARPPADIGVEPARRLGRTLERPWCVTSYTSLVRHADAERPDHDAGGEEPARVASGRHDLATFPPGARAGNCVHRAFERADFTDPDTWPPAVRGALAEYGFEAGWEPVLLDMVARVVATPLDDAGLVRLARVGRTARLNELEFHRPLARLDSGRLRRLLASHRFGAGPIADAVARTTLPAVAGFLKGFIDLVFECEGRFWIVDYKSNRLGDAADAYAPERLPAVIAREGYWLQYLLYTTVVHRFLRARLAGYDYERHVGGVRYLFVRGMNGTGSGGVYRDRPSAALIAALDAELGEAP